MASAHTANCIQRRAEYGTVRGGPRRPVREAAEGVYLMTQVYTLRRRRAMREPANEISRHA